jgi:hypothetical protein
MNPGLRNYAAIMLIENSCIKFNNNETSSLQRYEIARNYRNLHKVVQTLSQHNLKISNHRHIQKLCHGK